MEPVFHHTVHRQLMRLTVLESQRPFGIDTSALEALTPLSFYVLAEYGSGSEDGDGL